MRHSCAVLLVLLSAFLFPAWAYSHRTSATVCATEYAASPAGTVKTTTYHKRTYTTATITRTSTVVTTTTPTSTITESDTTTTTTTTSLSIVTDTFSTTTTSTLTDTATATETNTETDTFTTTTTSTSTTTIQPSAGFQPINPGAASKRDLTNELQPRATQSSTPHILLAVLASSYPGGKRHYATAVVCDVVTTYSTRKTNTVVAPVTSTATASPSTTTTTELLTSTSTVTVAPYASTTVTSTETDEISTTITTTTTTTTSTTITSSEQAAATYYAACAPDNQLSSDNDNSFLAPGSNYGDYREVTSAYDCCASCIQAGDSDCAASYFIPIYNQCTFVTNNMCATNNVAGRYSTGYMPGTSEVLSNSNCGIWQYDMNA